MHPDPLIILSFQQITCTDYMMRNVLYIVMLWGTHDH